VAILSTNEKLRAAARELHCPILAPEADAATVSQTLAILADGAPVPRRDLLLSAERAAAACGAFVERAARSTVAPGRRTT
jgi:DNA-binding NarL/FixJ family response regulator